MGIKRRPMTIKITGGDRDKLRQLMVLMNCKSESEAIGKLIYRAWKAEQK